MLSSISLLLARSKKRARCMPVSSVRSEDLKLEKNRATRLP
jgi:hypothetical protein